MKDFSQDQFQVFRIGTRTFSPFYTPEKLLDLGVFDVSYFQMATEKDFEGLRPTILDRARQQAGRPQPTANAFGVHAGQDYEAWMKNGWIFEEDSLGWFHWYCRFISGRRHHRDEHQMGRWAAYARWHSRALSMKKQKGAVSAIINQELLHWSWPVVV